MGRFFQFVFVIGVLLLIGIVAVGVMAATGGFEATAIAPS